MKQLNVGIVGYGWAAGAHIDAINAGTLGRVTRVCSSRNLDYYHGIGPWYFHTHLVGSEGSLLDNRFHSNRLDGLSRSQWSQLSFKPVDSGDVADHPYQTQFDTYFEALRRGEDMPLTGLSDAVRTHEVIFAADRSWQEHRPVKLEEIRAA